MKAVRVTGYHQRLEMTEVDTPEVTGPHDVLVRVGQQVKVDELLATVSP